jgi:hypothetical protein
MTETARYLDDAPQPIHGERGASILGPRNLPLERENPDLLASPYTDWIRLISKEKNFTSKMGILFLEF